MFQFYIPFTQLWIWEHALFTLLCKLKCPLNLCSQQRKVFLELLDRKNTKVFWVENFGLLGIKTVHGQHNSSSWYSDSWPYIVPPRVEPHCKLSSLLVHWSYQEKNTYAMLYKCRGVCWLKHRKSDLQNDCTYRQNRSLL